MPLTKAERIALLAKLGDELKSEGEALSTCIQQSYLHNRWFTPDNSRLAIQAICDAYLQAEKLESWLADYPVQDQPSPLRVGLVMAGNIPLVGFHDLLCVFATGLVSVIKLSEKDKHLLPFLIGRLCELDGRAKAYFQQLDRLADYDAVIATGSNNSARYFKQYFGKHPHIIRRNRNGVAVLTGEEQAADLETLGIDIFRYFGLGCRNVSKLYVPQDYDFTLFLEATYAFKEVVLHDKYKNNFDYNYTLYILNKVAHLSNGCILLVEDEQLASRIASLHFEYYEDELDLVAKLKRDEANIQCVIAGRPIGKLAVKAFGEAQQPKLHDYADGVDTLQFLTQLAD